MKITYLDMIINHFHIQLYETGELKKQNPILKRIL